MLQHTLGEWRDKHFWILLFLSLVVLFCVYRITLPLPLFINLGTEGDERYLRNFHSREQSESYPFRWTKDSSYIKIPNLGSLSLEIVLGADAARPEGQPLPRVALIANGAVLADFTMQNGIQAHRFLYHPPLFPLSKDLLLEVKSDTFASPGDEYRALGILVNTVEIKPITSPSRLLQVPLMGALSIAFSYLLLRWLGVSQRKSLVCGTVVLALLSLNIVERLIIARFLVGVFGLLLVGYVLAILLEARGYREPMITHLELARKTLETWARNLVSAVCNSLKTQALSPHSQSSGIPGVLPAYLPAVVLFILMPFALYLPNQSIFDSNLTLVIPYLVLAVVYFIFLIALLFFVAQPLRTIIVILLFYIGLCVCLSDIMSPVQLGELMAGRETPKEPLFLTVVEVVLAIIVILGAIKLPWKWVKRFGSIFVLLLLISEAIVVFDGLSPETSLLFTKSTKNMSNPPEKLADGGNIYHITFDAYSNVIFLESLEEMKLTEEFDGFTFFRENRANYDHTVVSVPSYMTGSFYEENDRLKEWQDLHKSSGIIKNIYDAGYEVSMYVRNRSWGHEKASHVKVHGDVLMQYESLYSYCHFADLWLLRVVPNFLQQEVYRKGKGVFTRLFEDVLGGSNTRVLGSVELMRQLINDEVDRPDHGQYVYAHFYIPHSPYIINRDCVFLPPDDTTYYEQALCATRLMAEFISKLKELGRYHKSTIIVQTDHGLQGYPCLKNTSGWTVSLEIEKEIEAVNLRRFSSAETIDSLTCALLLIKPPLQWGRPLVISDSPTQLADIPATLYDLLDLPVRVKEGESFFSPDFPETREIHIFLGLYEQRDEKGKRYVFGKNLFEGEANHFSFTSGKGCKIYPNIHVRWK
jgi:hypothetical protein